VATVVLARRASEGFQNKEMGGAEFEAMEALAGASG